MAAAWRKRVRAASKFGRRLSVNGDAGRMEWRRPPKGIGKTGASDVERWRCTARGGIGKSTTVSNVAAALALRGYTVMQIGCDPKADSTYVLMAGRAHSHRCSTSCGRRRRPPRSRTPCTRGFAGVLCVEAGGPTPGTGCAGRGVITAFEQLAALHAYEGLAPDIVLYDVLGDVVCGGFSLPLRGEHSDVVYVVTSGEMMSMYAASNIAQALERFKARDYARFGGLVLNRRDVADERALVESLADELGTGIVADVPRSADVHACEQETLTVVEGAPASAAARAYGALADAVLDEAGLPRAKAGIAGGPSEKAAVPTSNAKAAAAAAFAGGPKAEGVSRGL